jgi:hypothetical protein
VIKDLSASVKEPAVNTERSNLADVKEYGYGFWLRYLTYYPARLSPEKDYTFFLARLTKNNPNTD